MLLRTISRFSRPVFQQHINVRYSSGGNRPLDIQWMATFCDAIHEAKNKNKPLMVCIHRPWSHASRSLMPPLKGDEDLIRMSHNFVMVEITKEREPIDLKYAPDGTYIPRYISFLIWKKIHVCFNVFPILNRIIFADPNGEVFKQMVNKANKTGKFKHYYETPAEVKATMKDVLYEFNK